MGRTRKIHDLAKTTCGRCKVTDEYLETEARRKREAHSHAGAGAW